MAFPDDNPRSPAVPEVAETPLGAPAGGRTI